MGFRPRRRLHAHGGNDLNRWTVSFADFMTLMFAVFVVLYSVSSTEEDKYKEVMQSIQEASKLLNNAILSSNDAGILDKQSNNILEDSGPALLSEHRYQQAENELSAVDDLKEGVELKQLKTELENLFSAELDNELLVIKDDGDWLTLEFAGQMLFAGGSHTLLISANELLKALAKSIQPIDNLIRVRGYADQTKVSNEIYFSNWELSAFRAFSVLHELANLGIDPQRMAVEAYGSYSPIYHSDGSVNNLASRRVVLAISRYSMVKQPSIELAKPIVKTVSESVATQKPDLETMQELHLPDGRLIFTTRQE
ncbi:flagellar motor protein MotB [Psychromonas sp. MME2]|uniref:flagellar motor protein MotB n=1 Tax=unclassified Psychromonas TaxID=2614957 RepID=UPI00339CC160